MHWTVSTAQTRLLMTGDTPVVTVSATDEINCGPVLLPELYEVQVLITPTVLLTISPFPPLGQGVLTAVEADRVNRALIRDCAKTILRHPNMPWPTDLTLPSKRAPLPTPHVRVTANGGTPTKPAWPAIVDNVIVEVIDILGGDPIL